MPIGARKDSSFYAVTVAPDVCLTPVGGAMVPVPYMLYASFNGSTKCIEGVNLNGKPTYVYDHSLAPTVQGDEPGTGGGVKSGVNLGKVWAHEASKNVRADGRRIVRRGDRCWMNVKA
ncbi:DUF4150 domain-containing protein [Sorangium sp. So ce385]|uniref:DUF4150 domain-containing protein n=1 Tax=Sorangium sp. So ce385 TaxID=3133308 RepID=UPI003F5C54FA